MDKTCKKNQCSELYAMDEFPLNGFECSELYAVDGLPLNGLEASLDFGKL